MGLIFLALAAAPTQVPAGSLGLRITPGCALEAGRVRVHLRIENRGTEPAHGIQPEARLDGRRYTGEKRLLLDPGDTWTTAVELGAPPAEPGIYTIALRLHYMDRTGYPVTAVETVPFTTRLPDMTGDTVSLSVRSAPLTRPTGTMTWSITNHSAEPIIGTLHFAAPTELPVTPDQIDPVRIAPHGHVEAACTISNAFALPGSRYAVFGYFTTTHGGMHHSHVARTQVRIPVRPDPVGAHRRRLLILFIACVAVEGVLLLRGRPRLLRSPAIGRWAAYLLVAGLTILLAAYLYPRGLLLDTLAVGGDTPAHNVLASQLKAQLFESGRLIGWSQAWWSGFPLFQYYFVLPYLAVALLSTVVPFNIAFKLVSVAGVIALPAGAFLAGRKLRLPSPAPVLLAGAMLILLFDRTHTMWGVNIYSTLAGMISNSWSFVLMLVFVACAARDADEGRFRLTSALLFAAMLASHFFTTVMAVLTLACLPFLRPAAGFRRAAGVLLGTCATGSLLMAWWLIPLIAKRAYSVDFGVNWTVNYGELLRPGLLSAVVPLAVVALWPPRPAHRLYQFTWMTAFMLAAALFLFRFGYALSPVFVNVRLWPFITYAVLALAAVGLARLLRGPRCGLSAQAAVLIAVLLWGVDDPQQAMRWSEWNFSGLERKPRWPVFRDLVLPLAGTPGRLANDLHEHNVSFGSSRIFEVTPHLTGKPILEGGLVNSAAGALFAYYIQSETSDQAAGYPPIVKPAQFNLERATRHLELFNVKHFLARSPRTQAAMSASPDWALRKEAAGWQLYELTTHAGRYVFVPRYDPLPVHTPHWKQTALDWIYGPAPQDRFHVLLRPGQDPPPPGVRPSAMKRPVTAEQISDRGITFTTEAVGAPHIVRCAYFPNWRVRGADEVFLVTPCFMLVYPTEPRVELYYGSILADTVGRGVTLCGILLCAGIAMRRKFR